MTPALTALRTLTQAGWVFTYPRDPDGQIIAGYGVRTWPGGWWDGLIMHAETHCEAMRANPDDYVTWERVGTVVDVVSALVELPPPGENPTPGPPADHHAREERPPSQG